MGRSFWMPSENGSKLAAPSQVHSEALHREFEVFERDGRWWQTERDDANTFRVEHSLDYAIGSGVNGISFAVTRGNHLFQAPLSYYTAVGGWDLSPGFENSGAGFNRPILESCIVCHSGRPQTVADREGAYDTPPFAEMAIGCENCHGPGSRHVRQPSRAAIVNPKRLPARLAEDICLRCHEAGDTRAPLPGKRYTDFQPGEPLIGTLAIFALASQARSDDLLQHHSSMQLSRCFRATKGKLSCLTCHNVHEEPEAAKKAAYFNGKCLICHQPSNCRESVRLRGQTAPADNCTGCHMPKRQVTQVSHSALTNHRIPARADAGMPTIPEPAATSGDLPGLVLVDDSTGKTRLPLVTRLAAYGELMARDRTLEGEYFRLLETASSSDSQNKLVLAARGRKALLDGQAAQAAELLTAAERLGGMSSVSYADLSEALTKSGRSDDALQALRRAQTLYPFSQALRKRVILAQIQRKDYHSAKAELDRYVADFPEDDFVRALLKEVTATR